MIVIRKKYIILAIIVIFVTVVMLFGSKIKQKTVLSDYPIGQLKKVSANNVVHIDKFADMRASRDKIRKDVVSKLNDTVNNAAADDTSRGNASQKISEIYDCQLKENECEEMIKLKGYKDVLVSICENSVDVSVVADDLTQNDIVIIQDIIINKTSNNNIKIVAVK